jgi:hypothetical protein
MENKMAGILKNIKKIVAVTTVLSVILILILSMLPETTSAATAVYKVEFRAGSHGTFSGTDKSVISAEYNNALSYIPEPDTVESGYWFTGYSPEIQNTVVENAVYVAQYAKLIDSVEYCVRYVDTTGASIATEKIAYANDGDTIAAYAKDISGYKADVAMKTITASSNGNLITFTYTVAPVTTGNQAGVATDNNQVIIYQNAANNAANAGNGANVAANNAVANGAQVAADETNVTPATNNQDNTNLLPEVAADSDVVLDQDAAGQSVKKAGVPWWVYVAAGVAVAAAAILTGITVPKLYKKRAEVIINSKKDSKK